MKERPSDSQTRVGRAVLDDAVVMAMKELFVASLAGGEVEPARVKAEAEWVGLYAVVLGEGPGL